MAYDILTAKTATSVCTICSAAIAINTDYARSGYDGRHIACHDGLTAALAAAYDGFIKAEKAKTAKSKTQVAIPTDAEQRALYQVAKKAGTLDLVVKGGRKAAPKAEAKPEPKAETKATAPKAETDPGADWDKRKARADKALSIKRITAEQHAAAIAELGARPEAATVS